MCRKNDQYPKMRKTDENSEHRMNTPNDAQSSQKSFLFKITPFPSAYDLGGKLLASEKWAHGARRPALGWGKLLLALGSLETFWALGAWLTFLLIYISFFPLILESLFYNLF